MTKPYVIMGANGGIGEKLSQILSEQGESLFLTARDTASIQDLPGQKHALDVLDAESVTEVVAKADEGDGIKGLAYCVGSIDLKPFGRLDLEQDVLGCFRLNVLGAMAALQAAEKGLKKANGSVILFSSVAVQQGFSNHGAIASAKGAIEGLTRSLAAEWAPKVRVNCIAPSLTDTGIAKSLTSSEQMSKAIAQMHPIPKLGAPEDSAELAAFLLGEKSPWITGQVMHVDGGRSSLRTKG